MWLLLLLLLLPFPPLWCKGYYIHLHGCGCLVRFSLPKHWRVVFQCLSDREIACIRACYRRTREARAGSEAPSDFDP
ncbi:hypothetical protein IWX92DRAFT_358064 [Phyllosticta citricarpa]